MKLSALLLTIVIALGLSAPLEARSRRKTPKAQHHSAQKAPKRSSKMPKVRKKPAKVKPMKYRKAKRSSSVKPAKVRKSKAPKSV